jgi:hypothetical protein
MYLIMSTPPAKQSEPQGEPQRKPKRVRGDESDKSDKGDDNNVSVGNKKRREWQLCDNWQARDYMTDLISMLLREKMPHASKEWQDKIPRIAQRLEEAIYYQSEKLAEYANPSTLKARLQQLALSVRDKNESKPKSDESVSVKSGESEITNKLDGLSIEDKLAF